MEPVDEVWDAWCALTREERERRLLDMGLVPPDHPARRKLRHPVQAFRHWVRLGRTVRRINRRLREAPE